MEHPQQSLTLKVMRVSRPTLATAWAPFYSSSPSFSAHSTAAITSLQGSTPLSGHPTTLRDLSHVTELLTLPSSFGAIQLGETFSSCLCVNNEFSQDIEDVRLVVEMQTATSKTVLAEFGGPGSPRSLEVGGTLETVVHSEMKEIGQHVLSCAVSYRMPNARALSVSGEDPNDPALLTFRKFYKFTVTNPLSVKTKVHAPRSPSALLSVSEREKIFLEVHIQNLTQEPMWFERMRFECVDGWTVENPDVHGSEEETVFTGSVALMQPQDLRQYIFELSPSVLSSPPVIYASGSSVPLGRLDISWRSSLGEPGRLLTSVLSRRMPAQAIPPPASALPLYLQRSGPLPAAVPPRPQSPQSRPSTPGPHRTHSPAPIAGPSRLPELIPDLVVQHIPHAEIHIEKPFDIQFLLTLAETETLTPGPHPGREVSLVVQHVQPPRPIVVPISPPQLPTQSPRVHSPSMSVTTHELPYSPRGSISMSGFSTPLSPVANSAAATPRGAQHGPSQSVRNFNYALAEQKLLVASPRESGAYDRPHQEQAGSTREGILPPPFAKTAAANTKFSNEGVVFVGSSTTALPKLRLDDISGDGGGENDALRPRQATHVFVLSYMPLRKGFMTLSGLRVLLVEDCQLEEGGEEEDGSSMLTVRKPEVRVLKEWPMVGEVYVRS